MNTHGIEVVRTELAQWKMLLLYKWLLVKPGYELTQTDYNHEGDHLVQQRETYIIGFYLWYALEFIFKFLATWNWNRAYRSVSFEQEAYGFENCDNWLQLRQRCHWRHYIFTLNVEH